ncbi:AAA family ATPase [Actinoplanes sp. HUAS TT8]|uniref:AAA family ATPase n=1 Tax=Actinoplanes sp. HUAS TT8 TaxID=3447453 RepID=UPI003F522CCD
MSSGASVLLAFRAENVRSFPDRFELSLLATALAKKEDVRQVAWRQGGQAIGVLPAAGIFGTNASGKSNVLRAMNDMRAHVLHSFRSGNPTGGIARRPYLLDSAHRASPTRFEIDLVLHGVRHEYGFVLDDSRIIEEWAYRSPHGRPAMLFHRRLDDVELGAVERAKGRAVLELLRPNALFLSTAAAANHGTLLPLYAWFERNLLLAEAGSRLFRQSLTTQLMEDASTRERVLDLLRAADLGITGVRRVEPDPATKERMQRALHIILGREEEPGSPPDTDISSFGLAMTHSGADTEAELDVNDESLGTMVWFGLVGPVITALSTGAVLLADELDSSLHPALVAQLVRLFHDQRSNPRRAQLIFNSHDAALLGDAGAESVLGRDQIWFTEKSEGASRLYPLSDLAPRKDEAIGKRYLAGRYGAVPILSHGQFVAAVGNSVDE